MFALPGHSWVGEIYCNRPLNHKSEPYKDLKVDIVIITLKSNYFRKRRKKNRFNIKRKSERRKTEGGGNQFILKVAVPFLGVLFCVVYLAMYLCVVFKCGSVVAYELNYITQTRR